MFKKPTSAKQTVARESKSSSYNPLAADFDLSKLKYFNPDLVAAFVPENPGVPSYKTTLYGFVMRVMQSHDLFNAMHFAEQQLIPYLQAERDGWTSERLIGLVHGIHKRVAFKLAQDLRCQAGEYCDEIVLRYVYSVEFGNDLGVAIVSGVDLEQKLKDVFKKYDLSEEDAVAFYKIYLKISQADIYVNPNYIKKIDPSSSSYKHDININKLAVAYYMDDVLTQQEKSTILKLFKVCLPERSQKSFSQGVANLIAMLKNISAADERSIIDAAAYAYYFITESHPYFNANGRTATIVMNSVLLSFGLPCIVFRTSEEVDNPNSSYVKVIRALEQNQPDALKLLTAHIEQKVLLAREEKSAPLDVDPIMRCVSLALVLEKVNKMGGNFDYSGYDISVTKVLFERTELHSVEKVTKFLSTLSHSALPSTDNISAFGLFSTQADTKTILINILQVLTGFSSWKGKSDVSVFWRNKLSKNEAHQIKQSLGELAADGLFTMSVGRQKGSDHWAVVLKNISLGQVIALCEFVSDAKKQLQAAI